MKKWLFALALTGCTIDLPELPDRAEKSSEMSLLDKKKGWSASGDIRLGDSTKEVSLQADFEEPGTYTLQFDVKYPTPNAADPTPFNANVNATADIFWSVEGNYVRRQITLTPGMTISGNGQGVKVKIYDSSEIFTANDPIVTYPISVQVVKGIRATTQPPYYQPAGSQVNGSILGPVITWPLIATDVPVNAGPTQLKCFAVFTAGGDIVSGGVFQLTYRITRSIGAPTDYVYVQDPQFEDWIPIPPGATNISLRPITVPVGATTAYLGVLWGVDG